MSRGIPLEIRFWAKVSKTDGCWLWTGATTGRGYGHIKIAGRMEVAHRVAYRLLVGDVPDGLDLDHLCRVRNCVRVDHLEPVTRAENTMRGVGATAQHARQSHCVHGHELTEANTYLWRTSRICRACKRARAA